MGKRADGNGNINSNALTYTVLPGLRKSLVLSRMNSGGHHMDDMRPKQHANLLLLPSLCRHAMMPNIEEIMAAGVAAGQHWVTKQCFGLRAE